MIYRNYFKRLLDFVTALGACIIFSPLLLIIAFMVRWRLGSPILFRQRRPGFLGQPFTILKFRTMTTKKNDQDDLLPDSERLTSFGQFLRKTSLDELPEMLNVLKGEMSLVGPRPLLMSYLDLYTSEQMHRHDTLPGITGWAQVNGRNNLSWEDKFALDIWYVDNLSLRLDLEILLQTVRQMIKREGINQPGQATVEHFTGKRS